MASHGFQQLKGRLKALCKDRPVLFVILISAVLVTGARIVAPFEVGKDQATQLEVSQRLVKGLGLTTTNALPRESYDISIEPSSKYVTAWPPGLSLLVASFLYAGLPLLAALKILYATTTLLGWIGWAIIASHFISRPGLYGKRYSWIHLTVVAFLPIALTPLWDGTDIFLWAGVPFVFICLVGFNRDQPSLLSVALAGLLVGSLYVMRYTSLFLGLAALLILFQVSYPQINTFFKRFAVFLLTALTVMIPATIYLMQAKSFNGVPLGAPNTLGRPGIQTWLPNILENLYVTSIVVLGHNALDQILNIVKLDWLNYSVGILSLIVIFSWPIILRRSASPNALKAKDDLALSFSFLPLSLVIFMLTVGVTNNPFYLRFSRYYEPVALCGVFLFYEIATRRTTHEAVRKASKAVVLGLVLYIFVFLPGLAFTNEGAAHLRAYVGGFTPEKVFKLYTPKEAAKSRVEQLYRDNPDAIFYVQNYAWFVYEGFDGGPVPGRNLRSLPRSDFWKRAYTTKPVKIFWVLNQKTSLDFIPDSKKQVIFSDSSERMKILVSDFASGPLLPDGQIAVK